MGLVSQEPVLFNDTIRANIGYGKEGKATEAEIIAAAELANAHNFICSLQQVIFFFSATKHFQVVVLLKEKSTISNIHITLDY